MTNSLPSAVDEAVKKFKVKNLDLANKSNAFIFLMLEINDKYLHFDKQELQDNKKIKSEIAQYIVSDKNDAPINFILCMHEPEADEQDLVIGKCNYDDNCTQLQIKNDINQLVSTYKQLVNMYRNYSENESSLYEQFADCYEDSMDGLKKFCMLYPKTLSQNGAINLDELQAYFSSLTKDLSSDQNYILDIEINNAVNSDIDNMESNQPVRFVSHDSIAIYPNNVLHYQDDAVIVSINGKSLHDLYKNYGNNLLEANLRYYVKNPKIDNEITQTITNNPQEFWYLNNGLTIICNRFKVYEDKVELFGFSIINGGQTTYLINKMDPNFENDLYIVCKIVRITNYHEQNPSDFILKIAQSSNRQKPINDQDLKTNQPEQLDFAKLCQKYGLIYEVRRGVARGKEIWQRGNVTSCGKLLLAALLQLPADARTSRKAVFTPANYAILFPSNLSMLDHHALIVSQLTKIEYCYKRYLTKDAKHRWPKQIKYAKNAKTIVIAFISLLSRLANNSLDLKTLQTNLASLDDLITSKSANAIISEDSKEWFTDSINFKQIYNPKITDIDDLQDKLTGIFDYVVINGTKNYLQALSIKPDLTETNYLKTNVAYYQFLLSIINDLPNDIVKLFKNLK